MDSRISLEFQPVLKRHGLHLPRPHVDTVLRQISDNTSSATMPPEATLSGFADPHDAPFAECALTAGSLLVTGNQRHFPKSVVGNLRVWSPRRFVDEISTRLQ